MRRVIVPALLAVAMVAGTSANANAFGLFDKLCKSGCDTGCAVEPACGCEIPCEPACGIEVAAPMCGCEVAPACDSHCGHKGGLLSKLFGKRHQGCDSCCDVVEPVCGCEVVAPCEPCLPEPVCGCEVAAPVCDSPCGGPKPFGFLKKLFGGHHNHGCDSCCDVVEPACGCEIIEPACGCETAPACGCH